jgi:hypothetical protein
MMSDAFLTFQINHLYNFQFKYTFVCIYSVYSPALNRYVEREKYKNFRNPLPCLRFTGRQNYPGEYTLWYFVLSETIHPMSILMLFFCFFAVKAYRVFTTQPNLSVFWLFLAPLSGLLNTITNHCILAKALFDDALPAATSGLNSCGRRHTDNIDEKHLYSETT